MRVRMPHCELKWEMSDKIIKIYIKSYLNIELSTLIKQFTYYPNQDSK